MIIDKLENEKREDIVSKVDKSIFVEAGAGAGKTTLIVQRITNQIRQGVVKPEELVVITFTNKAAGELFERIQKSFENEEKNFENTTEQRERFTYAIEHIEQMHISTIHSFCFSLLKERCFDSKLPLDVCLLENGKNIERQKGFYLKWLSKLDKSSVDEIKEALTFMKGNSYYYGNKLEELFIKICEKPNDINFVCLDDNQLKLLKSEIEACVLSADILLRQLKNDVDNIASKGIEIYEKHTGLSFYPDKTGLKLKTFYKGYEEKLPIKGNDSYSKNIKELYSSDDIMLCNKGTKPMAALYEKVNEEFYQWLESNIRHNDLYEQWYTTESAKKEKANSYAYYVLIKYVINAREIYLKELDNTQLSNEQLIQKAKDLVCNCKEARLYYGNKYKCIYVDEFQDTDHIQADLIWKLACDENDKLKAGALFVVGDPKQAIYRFRGGEPAVYNQIKKLLSDDAEAEVYELDNNFRSNKPIIDWVNKQFNDPISKSGIKYRDMLCTAQNYPEEMPSWNGTNEVIKGVYKFDALGDKKFKLTVEKTKCEATLLALLIKKMVLKDVNIYETKKNGDEIVRVLRPVHYGDFLILCWNTTEMNYYVDALKEASIPVDLAGKTDIESSRVLKNFLLLYRFLVRPMDEKSKQGAFEIICRTDANDQRVKYILEAVKDMNCYSKAQYILQHIEYILPWDVEVSKENMYSVQARLYQMVETVFSQAKEDPENILTYFEEYLSNNLEHELMLEEDNKAVRFMNLHKAKGLEGNITIIVNRKKLKDRIPEYTASTLNSNQEYDYYGCISDMYSSIHGYNYDATTSNALQVAKTEDEAERIRLEYVAATRAKEVLIIGEAYGDGAPFCRYEKPIDDIESIFAQDANNSTSNTTVTEIAVKGGMSVYDTVLDTVKKDVFVGLSPSDLEGIIDGTKDERAINKDKLPRRPKGNIFGTTMHRSFELFIRNEGDIKTCVSQAIIENYDDLLQEGISRYLNPDEEKTVYIQAVKEYLENVLDKFNNDEVINNLLINAKNIFTELPFSYYVSQLENPKLFEDIKKHLEYKKISIDEDQKVWINGTADLVIVDSENNVHVIDFKSDTNYEESIDDFESVLYQKYEGQLLLYKYAMSRIFEADLEHIYTELYHLYK